MNARRAGRRPGLVVAGTGLALLGAGSRIPGGEAMTSDPTPAPKPSPATWEAPCLTRERVLVLVLATATVLVIYFVYRMALPFLPALTWAIALAILARPVHRWFRVRFARPGVAAGLAVLTVAIFLLVPTLFVVDHVVTQAGANVQRVQE